MVKELPKKLMYKGAMYKRADESPLEDEEALAVLVENGFDNPSTPTTEFHLFSDQAAFGDWVDAENERYSYEMRSRGDVGHPTPGPITGTLYWVPLLELAQRSNINPSKHEQIAEELEEFGHLGVADFPTNAQIVKSVGTSAGTEYIFRP